MNCYVALLRGINVGGKTIISMAALKEALTESGLTDVQTYIQSGNLLFSANNKSTDELARLIQNCIQTQFNFKVTVAVFTSEEWCEIIDKAPRWWGVDKDWKHNLLVLVEPIEPRKVADAIGRLKQEEIERLAVGKRVLYQSVSWEYFGKSTTGKLAANPMYKKMTVRNYNTATKLAALLAVSKT